jgi:hypothetical protein
MLIAREGEEIVCPKGTVCVALHAMPTTGSLTAILPRMNSPVPHRPALCLCLLRLACGGARAAPLEGSSPPRVGAVIANGPDTFWN